MENNSLSNKSKAIALFKWTNRKYLSVSIAYWILLFLAYPLAEILWSAYTVHFVCGNCNRIFNCNILNCIFVHA